MNQGSLHFAAGIDLSQWKRDMAAIRADIQGVRQSAEQQSVQMDNSFKKIGAGLAGAFSVAAISGFVKEVINIRGEFQKTEIAFGTMLKSQTQAAALMEQMVDLAAKTPFSLQEVSSGAKQLLAFQIPANEVVDTLTRMGNIAAGLGVPLGRINLVYGQVKAKGKLAGDDLRQFTEAGIPMVAELARKFGKTTAEISEMVSAGKIGFKDVQDVLFGLTNEGGMFFNLMEKQSASLSGKVSNLGDAWDQMLNSIGTSSESLLGDGIDAIAFLVDNYRTVLDVVQQLIVMYGAYRAALMVNAALIQVAAAREAGFTTAMMARLTVTRLTTIATAALNSTMMKNPAVLLITAITGLAFAMYKFRDSATDAERVNKKVTESLNAVKNAQNQLKSSTTELVDTIRAEHATQLDKYQAYQKLQVMYPGYLKNISMENFLKMETVEINKMLAQAQEKTGATVLDSQIKAAEQRIAKLKQDANTLMLAAAGSTRDGGNTSAARNQKDLDSEIRKLEKLKFIQTERNETERIAGMSAKDRIGYYEKETKSLERQLYEHKARNKNLKESDVLTVQLGSQLAKLSVGSINAQIQRMNAGLAEARATVAEINKPLGDRTSADWNKIKTDAQTKLSSLTKSQADGKEGAALKAQISQAEKALKSWDVAKETSAKKDKVYATNSIGWIDDQINKLQELQKNTVAGSAAYNKYEKQIKDFESRRSTADNSVVKGSLGALEKELSDVRDRLNNKTLLSDEKTRATLINRERELAAKIEQIRKASEVKSFEEQLAETKRQIEVRDKLLAQGYDKNSVDAMFPEVKDKTFVQYLTDVAAKLKDTNTREAAEDMVHLQDVLTEFTQSETFIDNVNKQIERLKEQFSGNELIDRLEKFKNTNLSGTTETDKIAKDSAATKAQDAELEAQRQRYDTLLKEQQTYEEKSLELKKQYDIMKASAEYQAASDADKAKIDKSFSDQQGVLDIEMIKKSKEWEVAFGELEGMTNTTLQAVLARLLEFKEKSKGTLSLQDSAELEKAIEKVRAAANRNPFTNLTRAAGDYFATQKSLTAAQKEYNAAVAEFGAGSTQAIAAQNKMIDADTKAMQAKQKLVGQLSEGQAIFNAVGQAVMDVGDAFGGFDDATNDAIGNIMAIGNAALDLGTSIAKGDVAGMIKAGAQLISSVFKAVNGDQKKERQIKKQAAQLKILERAYNDLAHAAEKAFGAQKYKGQQDMIKNLEQQKAAIELMARAEGSKKKKDQGKIDEYNAQVQSINQAIDGIKDSIIKDVLQTDIPDMAAKIGDALLDAFGKGEDGIDAINRAFDDMVKNMLKNQLNKILEKDLAKVVDSMRAAMGFNADGTGSFNGLTPEEIADLRAQVQAATSQGQQFIDAYAAIFEGLDVTSEGLKGDIKGMTEKTAGALEAQINAMRINQIISQDILRNSLLQLIQIELNTRNLVSIRQDISEMNGKMQKGLAGIP